MRTEFITSAAGPSDFPETRLPEVAFVGRSNVGKSSLLNALTHTKSARTSRTPGRTQLINFFEVDSGKLKYMLADLPGRGYAKAPGAVRAKWSVLIERYLAMREPLAILLFLLDARRGAEEEDVDLYQALVESLGVRKVRIEVVATKCDKLAKAEIKPVLAAIASAIGIPKEDVIPTSSSKRTGLDTLQKRIFSGLRQSSVLT